MLGRTFMRKHPAAAATAVALGLLAVLATACRPLAPIGLSASGVNPSGNLDLVQGGDGEVRVAGWATQYPPEGDSARQRSTPIVLMIDGRWAEGSVPADDPRADVESVLVANQLWQWRQPDAGYGFDHAWSAPAGEVSVCVVALNPFMSEWGTTTWVGPPDHVLFGCRTVTVS